MDSAGSDGRKRPQIPRPFPRRLFTTSSVNPPAPVPPEPDASTHGGAESYINAAAPAGQARVRTPSHSKDTKLSVGEDPFSDGQRNVFLAGATITESPTSSPDEQRSFSPVPTLPTLRRATARPRPVKKSSLLSTISSVASDTIPDEPPSPSKRRWDDIRRHFLPPQSTAPAPSEPAQAAASPSPVSQTPPRPSTPKQFRIGKLGFKQVVEQAQGASVDQAKRFADDVLRASRTMRSFEVKAPRRDREGTLATMATSLNMTFMAANASFGMTSPFSVSSHPAPGRAKVVRRPPSLQSVATSSQGPPSTSTSLHAVISYYASVTSAQHIALALPHEDEVLSALLVPFTSVVRERAEDEQLQAIETFEILVKTWRATSDEASLERCLWCCRAMRMMQSQRDVRMRLLGLLSSCLFTSGSSFRTGSPTILQTLFQALFSIQAALLADADADGASYLRELVAGVRKGSSEDLDGLLLEQQYGVQVLSDADAAAAVDCLMVMALAACLENSPERERQHVIHYLIPLQENWLGVDGLPSSGLSRLEIRSVVHYAQALLSSLSSPGETHRPAEEIDLVFQTFRGWVVMKANAFTSTEMIECKTVCARLAINLLHLSRSEIQEAIVSMIRDLYDSGDMWSVAFGVAVETVVREDNWQAFVAILVALMKQLPNDTRSSIVLKCLPALNERLVYDPPQYPFPELTALLENVSQSHPKLFYKPLFSCAAGTKELSVLAHLRVVVMLARYLPSFWIRDVEMMLVALMSDSNSAGKAMRDDAGSSWGQVRLGQLALLVELIAHVQAAGQDKSAQTPSNTEFLNKARFFFTLEYRLGSFIEIKERTSFVPLQQRTLLVILLTEIRLLLRSLKPAQWLPRIISWTVSYEEDKKADPGDATETLNILTAMYNTLRKGSHIPQKRKSAPILSPSFSADRTPGTPTFPGAQPSPFPMLFSRDRQLETVSKGLIGNSLRLLVAMSGLLSREDHEGLCAFLWRGCLDRATSDIQAAATFLIMQGAEKAPATVLGLIRNDLRRSSSSRLQAARSLSLLSGWRFQILSQDYVADKNHRRPFKLTRTPVAFMATDIGSSSFVLKEDSGMGGIAKGQALPLELRKRLADIGWTQDEGPVDQKYEWMMTPFSLLSGQQFEKLDSSLPATTLASRSQSGGLDSPPSPALDPAHPTPGVKRRSIFVPPLASILPDLAILANDGDHVVANASRVAILDLMRHDSALITRPALDSLSVEGTSLNSAFSTLRDYLQIQDTLPPAMAHHVFNHLTGYLKFSARQVEERDTLKGFAYSLPLLSKLVPQVSDMSLRELRRAKVDVFLIPSGSLWFPPTAPAGPMFPRSLSDVTDGFNHESLLRLGLVVFIRAAQNLLFVNILKRNRQEVQAVRKNMSRLVLPSMGFNESLPTESRSFYPRIDAQVHADVSGLSLLLSRSYVLLVTEIFRSMPRHLNDRNELGVLIDGLNQILLAHGDDIGIIAHVVIALMTASTRFHRLFTSGGGYTLFMPVLFKVYAQSESDDGVRRAIEYGINRFYALHQDAFVFQTLNVLSYTVMSPDVDGPWMAKHIFALLSTLKDNSPAYATDAAGIHGSNQNQEREALLVRTAEEKPQAFLSLLRNRSGSQGEGVGLAVPDQYEGSHLALDNFVRLLLTVIGHDPGIRRAEQFLRLLRLMTPHFYESPAARNVLHEGINALSVIFIARSAGKLKNGESSQTRIDDTSLDMFAQAAAGTNFDPTETAKAPSNLIEMRFDYLSLVAEFSQRGSHLGPSASGRVFDLVKLILKDSDHVGGEKAASFLGLFAHNILVRPTSDLRLKQILAFLNELGPIFKAYAASIDFSAVLEVVARLAGNSTYAREPAFSLLVVTQFCTPGLEAFEQLASEGFAFSTPLRPVLVKLLCRGTLLAGVDVMNLVEQRPLTFEFVAGILYPMSVELPTTPQVTNDTRWKDAWQRTASRRTWVRLVQLAMRACQKQRPTGDKSDRSSVLERTRSQEKKKSVVKNSPIATLSIALQVLKVIVMKAEDDLSASLPSIWVQLGSLLKGVLATGNAKFATLTQGISAPPSPLQMPVGLTTRSSEDSDLLTPASPRTASRAPSPLSQMFTQPFIIDYLLWSTLEFVCRYRSPLMLQLRLFLQETSAILDRELRAEETLPVRGSRISYASVFSKPRRKSGLWSAAPSPEASPFLTPVKSFPGDALLTPPRPEERKPGYARTPTTPAGPDAPGPRIVHLGPVQNPDMFRRSPSPGLGDGFGARSRTWLLTNSTTVKSTTLVRATYRRIRAVQRMMGYTELLPLPDGAEEDEEGVGIWSRGVGLRAIEAETKDLMEEFWEFADDHVSIGIDSSSSLS
ncbi:hypothetical protein BC834DRAFT_823723 [Gloeopeniophorella convolvens]|nr:hypothetical protein BC834DRAFT_823723 [Gloeopeniophorella convolvens]